MPRFRLEPAGGRSKSFALALLFAVFPAFAICVPSSASLEASVGRRGLRITAFDEEGVEDLADADAGFAEDVDRDKT